MAERLFSAFPNPENCPAILSQLRNAIQVVDWAGSPAGAIDDWPAELHSTVRVTLRAASPMAVLIGREGIVICNAAAREMFGDAFGEAQGRSIFEVLPLAGDFWRRMIEETYHGRDARLRDCPIKLWREGTRRTCWFNLGISPVADDRGRVLGTWLAASETTEHVRTRRALNLAHQRMEIALEAGGIVGTWDFDVASRRIAVDGSLAAQYGLAEAAARRGVPVEILAEAIHPDDRDGVLAALAAAAASGVPPHRRFRATTGQGQLRWYVTSGRRHRRRRRHPRRRPRRGRGRHRAPSQQSALRHAGRRDPADRLEHRRTGQARLFQQPVERVHRHRARPGHARSLGAHGPSRRSRAGQGRLGRMPRHRQRL
jgi:PAS domain-containing protein